MPPERTDLVLSSDVPNGEGDVLVLDSLDVETWRDVSLSISFAAFLRRDAAALLHTLLSQAEHPSVTQNRIQHEDARAWVAKYRARNAAVSL